MRNNLNVNFANFPHESADCECKSPPWRDDVKEMKKIVSPCSAKFSADVYLSFLRGKIV